MVEGEVTFFHDTGGYGFIDAGDEYDDDVYFHMANIDGPDLEEGQSVEFEVEEAEEGPRATNLTRLDGTEEDEE
jgi:CspA family cold shock protein